MRTEILYTNQDCTIPSTSVVYTVDCGQDMRWMLQVVLSGTDGSPKMYIEESADLVSWIPLNDNDCTGVFDYFLLDDSPYSVRDSYFMGKAFRIRIDPNDNTTGTIDAKLVVKTKSN